MDISVKLKKLRRAAKLSQSDLAKKVGVTREAISLWESGQKPNLGNLSALADVLGVHPGSLLGSPSKKRAS